MIYSNSVSIITTVTSEIGGVGKGVSRHGKFGYEDFDVAGVVLLIRVLRGKVVGKGISGDMGVA